LLAEHVIVLVLQGSSTNCPAHLMHTSLVGYE